MITSQFARVGAALLAAAGAAAALAAVSKPAIDGARVLVAVTLPVLFAVFPLIIQPGRARRIATAVAAVLLSLAAVLELFIAGLLFVPAAAAMVAAVALRDPESRAT